MTRRARIALLTHDDPEDRRSWSGISHFMAAALQRHCGDVVPLGPIRSWLDAVGRYLDRASRRLSGKKYDYGHSVVLAKRYAAIIQSRLAHEACDLIVAGSASTDVAFLDTTIPIMYASGTTFRLIHNYYPDYSNLTNKSSREGHIVEGRAIRKASLLVYPSAWAARSAVEDYGAEAAKVHVVPFGANLEEIPSREAVLARKRSERCQLLFLGVDWVRKGGDIALATLRRLEERGIQAHLVVCGCVPPPGIQHDRMTVIPFLDKSVDAERRELSGLLFTSDFLLLPTRSECFGIVFCEASAFGLPAITTDTGGVSGAVRNGENGFLLPPSAGGPEYADLIQRLYRDEGRYDALVRSSRAAFDTRLNWDAWGLEMSRVISQVLPSQEGGVSGSKNRGGAAAPTRAQEVAAEDVARHCGDYPLLSRVEAARRLPPSLPESFRATGLAKSEYLLLANGVVRYFAGFQNKRGAIIDPYERAEKQYATPAFACAAAILYASGYNTGLLPQCLKALDWATDSLASGRAADGHADFYTLLLMHALHALRGHVAPRRLAGWQRRLGTISAKNTYTFQADSPELHNWNLAAVSGEWMRYRAGLLDSLDWIEASLSRQMTKFTSYGMYQDPGDPLAYDTFARYCVVNLLEQGYSGRHAAMLDELMTRGAWTSLFLQSPQGEMPCGGRSGHHQWIEAAHAMICEVYARRLSREGAGAAAGAFKRSARLALQSIARWVRPSGDLWIVKNRSDPALRHGYESYSFHSQYNLLTAAALATAYQHADDSAEERPCPAEIGGFALAIQPEFHKVFANAGGLYLEIDTRADAQYNPTGLLRIHRRGVQPQVSVSDGVSAGATYALPTRPTRSLALGPGWRGADGVWHSLAAHDGTVLPDAEVRIDHESADRVEFSVAYGGGLRGDATQVTQLFTVTPFRVEVTDVVEGPITGYRQYFPLFATDGERSTSITVAGRQAAVQHPDGSRQEYEAEGEGSALVRLGIAEPSRNGALDAAYVESATPTMRCSIQPIAAGESGSGSTG